MTYIELRELAEELCRIWGYNNSPNKPNWGKLVNQGYRDLAWDADAIKGPSYTFTTTANQAEYVLTSVVSGNARDWKTLLDVLHDGNKVEFTDEAVVRRDYPTWLTAASSKPRVCWMPRSNVLRFHPKPDTSSVTVTIYGIQAPVELSLDGDTPVIPVRYHEAIAVRAAYLQAKKYAKGDATDVLFKRLEEYNNYLKLLKNDLGADSGMDGYRVVLPVEPERVGL